MGWEMIKRTENANGICYEHTCDSWDNPWPAASCFISKLTTGKTRLSNSGWGIDCDGTHIPATYCINCGERLPDFQEIVENETKVGDE